MPRRDVTFRSQGVDCAAWHYQPEGAASAPCVILGHGLGGVKEARLAGYAQRFEAAGFASLVFDYRYFGGSAGEPRQLMSIRRQLEDWEAAIAFARRLPGVDGRRLAIWGTSFSGGHVMVLAARHPELAGAVAQCPYTSGVEDGVKKKGWRRTLRFVGAGLADTVRGWLGLTPLYLPIWGKPDELAILTSPNAEKGYRELLKTLPPDTNWKQYITARFVLGVPFYHPVRHAPRIKVPLLVCVCDADRDVGPAGAHEAARLAGGRSIGYPIEHFEIYLGEAFEQVVADQIAFLAQCFGAPVRAAVASS